MQKFLFLFLLMIAGSVLSVQAQQPPETPAQKLAKKQAKRMKDSLDLTSEQRHKLYAINMDLYQKKTKARMDYQNDSLQMRQKIQQVEKTRDSLYKTVLPPAKYTLYLQKKRTMIAN